MRLDTIFSQIDPSLVLSLVPKIEVLGLAEDSRLVSKGDLFIARPGTKTDGAAFVQQAIDKGAAAVVTGAKITDCKVPQIVVKDVALAATWIANAYHGFPSQKVKVIGVTGTNGKTTTTYLIRHLLNKVNRRCGMIGTVTIDDGAKQIPAEMTTPGAIQVAELLADMRNNGCDACAIETSSHALAQHRVAAVQFAAAAFTNLTLDHLDYHKTMEDYAAAKARLFDSLSADAVAVVNADDEWTQRIVRDCPAKVIRFGVGNKLAADYRARDVKITASGSHFVLVTPDGEAEVHMRLVGQHNIENALCAAALVGETFGLTVHQIAAGLADAAGAPGRLQPVIAGQKFAVLVDYAHTNDALENVLSALRPLTKGKLRVVFGCGGDRDRTKRPLMAAVAEKYADAIYVTSDNPRTENAETILGEIVRGFMADSTRQIMVDADRRSAIGQAIADAEDNDVVLIAGKGHEDYQIIGTTKHHFDDVEEAKNAVLAGSRREVAGSRQPKRMMVVVYIVPFRGNL